MLDTFYSKISLFSGDKAWLADCKKIFGIVPNLLLVGKSYEPYHLNRTKIERSNVIIIDITTFPVDFVAKIKKINDVAKILVISDSENDLLECLRLGADGYSSEKRAFYDILDHISRLIAGNYSLDKQSLKFLIELQRRNIDTDITSREIEILEVLSHGLSYDQIAEKLDISVNTVRSHIEHIYSKLDVNNKTTAIEKARSMKLILN